MSSLKELRIRIGSVKSTQKITKAMKLVAASKLRRAREGAEAARPYAERMERMLQGLSTSVRTAGNAPALLSGNGNDKTHLLIIATADRGLCGGFNSTIIRASRLRIRELTAAGKSVKLYCVGRKGYDALKREYGHLMVGNVDGIAKGAIDFAVAKNIAALARRMFEKGDVDVVSIFYNKFISVISQKVTLQQLIPLPEEKGGAQNAPELPYEYEPSETAILADLLPRNVEVQIFHALLENAASEQGARMSAMENATRNAGDMIDRLTLQYNRSRQATITKELIEIISGAEAL